MANVEQDNLILGMSLVSTAVDRGSVLLDYFLPLVARSISDISRDSRRKRIFANEICDHIKQHFDIDVPLHTSQALCRRAGKVYKLEVRDNGRYIQIDDHQLEAESESHAIRLRRFNELCVALSDFAKDRGVLLTKLDSQQLLVIFMRSNALTFSDFLVSRDGPKTMQIANEFPETARYVFSDFLVHIRDNNDSLFNTLRETYCALTLVAILETSASLTNLPRIEDATVVFLDTNYLMRLLDWQTSYETRAAKELFDILKANKIETQVFEFTLKELRDALKHYGKYAFDIYDSMGNSVLKDLSTNGIASAVRRRRLTKMDFQREVNEVNLTVEHFGIGIIDAGPATNTQIDETEKECLINEKRSSPSNKDKSLDKIEAEAIHDIAAITRVRKARKKKLYRFKDAKHWFLTQDHRLYWANAQFHRDNQSVPEAILDYNMTTLLWIASRQGVSDAAVDQLISRVAMNATFSISFLRKLDEYIKSYMERNPDDLPYANDVYTALARDENRDDLLAAQASENEALQEEVFSRKMQEALEWKRKHDKDILEGKKNLEELVGVISAESKKSIDRIERQFANAQQAFNDYREKSALRESQQQEKILVDRAWYLFALAAATTIVFALLAVFLPDTYTYPFVVISFFPFAAFYYLFLKKRTLPDTEVFFRFFGKLLWGIYAVVVFVGSLVQFGDWLKGLFN